MTSPHEKITDMVAATTGTPASDLLEVVLNPGTTPLSRKITWHDFHLLSAPDIYTHVNNNANISIPTGTWTACTYNTEVEDDYAFHSVAVNTSRLTVPSGYDGLYAMIFDAQFAIHITGLRWWRIILNGATELARWSCYPATAANNPTNQPVAIYPLVATDYVEGEVYHTRGAALNVSFLANVSPMFRIMRVGRSP